jgi:N-acetylglucosamine kinase-like BadF-type ATPase
VSLVVGIDAGGTRTIAVAARDDEQPRTHATAGANPNAVGIVTAAAAIAEAVAHVAQGETPDAIVVGGAGLGRPRAAEAVKNALRDRFPFARIEVTHDLEIALRAAVPHGDGIVLVAGTGSAAYGEIGERAYRVGGGGYALGDGGSGYVVGTAGLRLLRRVLEGRQEHDDLTRALAAQTHSETVDELAAYVYDAPSPPAAVASAAASVLELADAGNRNAAKIVQAAALNLFELARDLCRIAGVDSQALPLAFCGGLLERNSLLTYLVETRVANELPNLRIIKGALPYLGALARARALRDGSSSEPRGLSAFSPTESQRRE